MNSNTHSSGSVDRHPTGPGTSAPNGLAMLAAAMDDLAAQDLDRLADAALADQVLQLRRLLDGLEGRWLHTLAAVDARGAAGAEAGVPAASTASWLRTRLHLGAGAAASCVRTARALFRGPLTATGQAFRNGELSVAHARCSPPESRTCPAMSPPRPNRSWVEAAGRLDPPRLRRVIGHLSDPPCQVSAWGPNDPDRYLSGIPVTRPTRRAR
jgi:hypothetical protein